MIDVEVDFWILALLRKEMRFTCNLSTPQPRKEFEHIEEVLSRVLSLLITWIKLMTSLYSENSFHALQLVIHMIS